jgi:hypothetical protein
MQQLRHADVDLKLRLEGIKDIPGVEDDSTCYQSDDR